MVLSNPPVSGLNNLIARPVPILGIFILRKKMPNVERPYKAFGYPIVPAIYILLAALVTLNMLIYQTKFSLYGLIIILIGVPVYYSIRKRAAG